MKGALHSQRKLFQWQITASVADSNPQNTFTWSWQGDLWPVTVLSEFSQAWIPPKDSLRQRKIGYKKLCFFFYLTPYPCCFLIFSHEQMNMKDQYLNLNSFYLPWNYCTHVTPLSTHFYHFILSLFKAAPTYFSSSSQGHLIRKLL